jgi:2,3-bisphosphoglycerate-independent phosphoglycerate mutase
VDLTDIAALAQPTGEKILLLVLDGLGGLPLEPGGLTELERARTPRMDALLASGDAGLHVPVARGVTPGSGPGHLSLFGYDPLRYRVGRGALAALGVEFPLQPGDVAIRGNLCTVDGQGVVTDRRAGRIPTDEARPVLELLDGIRVGGAQAFVRPVKEHRFLLVLRPEEETGADIEDTDPGVTGVPPLHVVAASPGSEPAARIAREWLAQAASVLAGQPRANMVLLRGFATLPDWPRFPDVFRMRSLAIAAYPMYRGVARLVGMDAVGVEELRLLLPAREGYGQGRRGRGFPEKSGHHRTSGRTCARPSGGRNRRQLDHRRPFDASQDGCPQLAPGAFPPARRSGPGSSERGHGGVW